MLPITTGASFLLVCLLLSPSRAISLRQDWETSTLVKPAISRNRPLNSPTQTRPITCGNRSMIGGITAHMVHLTTGQLRRAASCGLTLTVACSVWWERVLQVLLPPRLSGGVDEARDFEPGITHGSGRLSRTAARHRRFSDGRLRLNGPDYAVPDGHHQASAGTAPARIGRRQGRRIVGSILALLGARWRAGAWQLRGDDGSGRRGGKGPRQGAALASSAAGRKGRIRSLPGHTAVLRSTVKIPRILPLVPAGSQLNGCRRPPGHTRSAFCLAPPAGEIKKAGLRPAGNHPVRSPRWPPHSVPRRWRAGAARGAAGTAFPRLSPSAPLR